MNDFCKVVGATKHRASPNRSLDLVVQAKLDGPLCSFLIDGSLPTDVKDAKKVRRTSARFLLSVDKKLYRRSFGGLYLLCLHLNGVAELLAELHEEICVGNSRGRSLSHRAMTKGFWWQKMQRDATEYVKKCDQCQKHAPIIHQLGGNLNSITNPWPSFPLATGNRKFVLVSTDYFMKWVEAEALANIMDVDVKRFVWKNIVTRFGVPRTLVSNNGLQFDSKAFREYSSTDTHPRHIPKVMDRRKLQTRQLLMV